MSRIFITGNAGSGKTFLALRFGPLLGLPAYSIDSILWSARWTPVPKEERLRRKREWMSTPGWLIEGFVEDMLAAAKEIVFLDVSLRTACARALRRNVRHLFRSRPGIQAGCPEITRLHLLVKFIWRYHRTFRRDLLRKNADPHNRQTIHHLRSQAELDVRVDALARRPAGTRGSPPPPALRKNHCRRYVKLAAFDGT